MKPSNVFALVTPAQLKRLPRKDAINIQTDDEKMVAHHFTSKILGMEWFVIGWNGSTKQFFGLSNSFDLELKWFKIQNLPGITRDIDWTPRSLSKVRRELQKQRAHA